MLHFMWKKFDLCSFVMECNIYLGHQRKILFKNPSFRLRDYRFFKSISITPSWNGVMKLGI